MSRLLDFLFPNPYRENRELVDWGDSWYDSVSDYTWQSWMNEYVEFCEFFGCDSGMVRKW